MKTKYLKIIIAAAFILMTNAVNAQADLFGTTDKEKVHAGLLIGANANYDRPAADFGKRFGSSYRIGPSLHWKTKSNIVVGVKFDFILGNTIVDPGFLQNITDTNGYFINNSGSRERPGTFLRGYAFGIQFGKIFSLGPVREDKGIYLMSGAGFMQYKINLFDKDFTLNQIRQPYRKGYDRLTNGIYIEQFAGYAYFSKQSTLNFYLGANLLVGFNQGRRDWQYDTNSPGNLKQTDVMYGLRGGIYIPSFKRKSEEFFFED